VAVGFSDDTPPLTIVCCPLFLLTCHRCCLVVLLLLLSTLLASVCGAPLAPSRLSSLALIEAPAAATLSPLMHTVAHVTGVAAGFAGWTQFV